VNKSTHWHEAQEWEKNWWGNCTNTYNEETKQITYAQKMGLRASSDYGKYPVYNLEHKSILDIGGGVVSLLLKCKNFKLWRDPLDSYCLVSDPILDAAPSWVKERYDSAGIAYTSQKAETLVPESYKTFDEVWIYNVLQHTENPGKIIANARKAGKLIRIFEWVDMPPEPGHPQVLTEVLLNKWLHGEGKVEQLNENGCVGKAYYGIFPANL
jgi:2-polyprenyl-3-methyl-5-hydroxy-6-metoxy-1,4-benzoquinol methylase